MIDTIAPIHYVRARKGPYTFVIILCEDCFARLDEKRQALWRVCDSQTCGTSGRDCDICRAEDYD